MTTECLACGDAAATQTDGLCAACARGGSERSGLWAAAVWLRGEPATTPDEVRSALAELRWESCSFAADDPDGGTWLLELPPLVGRLLLTLGHVCQAAGTTRVEVELP